MSHDNREVIELYKKHKKECEQHILMDMTKIFDIEDMMHATVWKLICEAIKEDIPREQRKDYVYQTVNKALEQWL